MILHTLNALPGTQAAKDCLILLTSDDTVLLLGDGVYLALPQTLDTLASSGAKVCALSTDVAAAGLAEQIPASVKQIDYTDFVALTEMYPRQQAWY